MKIFATLLILTTLLQSSYQLDPYFHVKHLLVKSTYPEYMDEVENDLIVRLKMYDRQRAGQPGGVDRNTILLVPSREAFFNDSTLNVPIATKIEPDPKGIRATMSNGYEAFFVYKNKWKPNGYEVRYACRVHAQIVGTDVEQLRGQVAHYVGSDWTGLYQQEFIVDGKKRTRSSVRQALITDLMAPPNWTTNDLPPETLQICHQSWTDLRSRHLQRITELIGRQNPPINPNRVFELHQLNNDYIISRQDVLDIYHAKFNIREDHDFDYILLAELSARISQHFNENLPYDRWLRKLVLMVLVGKEDYCAIVLYRGSSIIDYALIVDYRSDLTVHVLDEQNILDSIIAEMRAKGFHSLYFMNEKHNPIFERQIKVLADANAVYEVVYNLANYDERSTRGAIMLALNDVREEVDALPFARELINFVLPKFSAQRVQHLQESFANQ